ncbi:MAG: hypothetical protein HY821_06790 [Acidobacteria bacterium]|nr:hypothetical protein [Acidobacteriota bacterium]
MDRRTFLGTVPASGMLAWAGNAETPLLETHFPSRLYQFVWRNWELANLDRMAAVVRAKPAELSAMGRSMGLPPKRVLSEDTLRRIYITVIRQNWYLLPVAQIVELLGWNSERFAFTLKEDDFLDYKLGLTKPECAELRYRPPAKAEQQRAAEIRKSLQRAVPGGVQNLGVPRFEFVKQFSQRPPAVPKKAGAEAWSPRFLYSYFALYGDPLMEGDAAGLPDGYLARVAECGINGVWIQGVLNTLAPSAAFPEFGKDWDIRARNLRALIERAARYGVRVFLYLNEPRAMPEAFFAQRPGLRGTRDKDVYAMCTSTEQVRDWLRGSVAHVFREAPGLGGILTITMSENHTNCFSHGGAWGDRDPVAKGCPRCSRRTGAETIAELIGTLRDGVRAESRTAEVMSYDWGWGTPLAGQLIPKLPRDTSVISVSEWSVPVERGGVKTVVGEYSMSVVGPGPRARRNWELARERGLGRIAKTQFNTTWEISAVPYIPVLPLVLEHCERLGQAGITGVMASWTCGGFPSPNLRAFARLAGEPRPAKAEILRSEAERIYGPQPAQEAVRAWEMFSEAFQFFPYGVAIYVLPVQHGPANLLRLKPTGLAPGMILFPHDAYDKWCGAYPPAAVRELMGRLARRWADGVALLEKLRAPGAEAQLELAVARTCQSHFESAGNQVEFYLLRDSGGSRERMRELAARERELALRQFDVARRESVIGYEASNHYYYTPVDLLEKVLNCERVMAELERAG